VRDYLAPEMATGLQTQCDRLRGARQTNRIEQLDVRRAELSEAWQEGGRDYVTVLISATMLDYARSATTLEAFGHPDRVARWRGAAIIPGAIAAPRRASPA